MCDAVERTVLCTSTYLDDAPLLNIAKENGLDIYAGSPDQPLERLIACAEMYGWQYVIRATGDNIFLDPDLLSQAVKLATDENLDYVSMTTAPVGSACEVFSTFALRTVQELANAPFTTEYLTWFVADNPNFRTMDLPIPSTLQRNYRLTLDTPDDLANIRDVTTRLGQDSSTFNLADVIAAVESDSELKRRCTFVPQATNAPAEVKFAFNVGSNIRSPE
jgi:spore coat polysaccharide biosynthesis protein SpsF